MPDSKKWIGSLKDNPAGKVVAEGGANRWEWDSEDETQRLLKLLENNDLSIESTDIRPVRKKNRAPADRAPPRAAAANSEPLKPKRDSGGGFNPYDHVGKTRRR
jgi:hypothetical protein